jgi:hypothetical protein
MTRWQLGNAMDLASGITGPPYDPGAARELCDVLEQLLARQLESESTWSRFDWLDGFIATSLERRANRVIVRGGIWVNAVRPEPCEIEVDFDEPRKLTLKFMDDEGTSSAKDIGRLKFPLQRTWRYVFILEHPNHAGEPEP